MVERVLVSCQDGKELLCRIRGKMKRRMWIRLGDTVLVSPWDFQSDKRGDIIPEDLTEARANRKIFVL